MKTAVGRIPALEERQAAETHAAAVKDFDAAIVVVEQSSQRAVLSAVQNVASALDVLGENIAQVEVARRKWLENYPANLPRPMRALFGPETMERLIAEAFEPFHSSMAKWNWTIIEKAKRLRDAAPGLVPAWTKDFRDMVAELKLHSPKEQTKDEAA
jgi:hypothetical protein